MENKELIDIGLTALKNARKRHDELGEDGLQLVLKNQFGQTESIPLITASSPQLALALRQLTNY